MAPGVVITLGECEKVSWVHVDKTEDNYFVSTNRFDVSVKEVMFSSAF